MSPSSAPAPAHASASSRRTSLEVRKIRTHVENLSLRYYAEPVFIGE